MNKSSSTSYSQILSQNIRTSKTYKSVKRTIFGVEEKSERRIVANIEEQLSEAEAALWRQMIQSKQLANAIAIRIDIERARVTLSLISDHSTSTCMYLYKYIMYSNVRVF